MIKDHRLAFLHATAGGKPSSLFNDLARMTRSQFTHITLIKTRPEIISDSNLQENQKLDTSGFMSSSQAEDHAHLIERMAIKAAGRDFVFISMVDEAIEKARIAGISVITPAFLPR